MEEYGGTLHGYEFKWSSKAAARPPSGWKNAYPNSEYAVITPANFLDYSLIAPPS